MKKRKYNILIANVNDRADIKLKEIEGYIFTIKELTFGITKYGMWRATSLDNGLLIYDAPKIDELIELIAERYDFLYERIKQSEVGIKAAMLYQKLQREGIYERFTKEV